MMKALIVTALAVCALPVSLAAQPDSMEENAYVAEANAIIMDFMNGLKGELQRALEQEGPVGAIGVCEKAAPEVTRSVAAKHGWKVGRTALKLRNPDNAPDEWERQVLERFMTRKEAGADPKELVATKVVGDGDDKIFRYMKAIPLVEKPCAICHGTNVDPDLRARILELYPQDEAVGFKPGDIRGAFTLSRKMD